MQNTKDMIYGMEAEKIYFNDILEKTRNNIKKLRKALNASKQLRSELAELEPVDETHERQIHEVVFMIDEIQDSINLGIETGESLIEFIKGEVRKLNRAIKALI